MKQARRKVALIGSFRKDKEQLISVFKELSVRFELLSPLDIEFINPDEEFVRAEYQTSSSANEIEENHLLAIQQAEFVWVFMPEGYVGTSGAFEIGFAHALGIPTYSDTKPRDVMLKGMITEIVDIKNIPNDIHKPGKGVSALQIYYKRIADERGWSGESARDTMLLLTEEIGELARAIRQNSNLKRDGGYDEVSLMDELADVQLYLVHLANNLGISLAEAVAQKEIKNGEKHIAKK